MKKRNKLIITPFGLPWDWSADFQKQTCLELAKNHLVIAWFQENSHFFLKRKIVNYPNVNNIVFFTPKYVIPFRRFELIDRLNQLINLFYLILRYGRGRDILLWIFDPRFFFYTLISPLVTTIYDCVDYHASVIKKFNPIIRSNDKKLITTVDHMFTNSAILRTIHQPLRKEIHVVPQGFRIGDFKKTSNKQVEINWKNKKNLTLGFIGALNDRIDFRLLIPLIKQNPNFLFVFWAHIQKENIFLPKTIKNIQLLLSLPNVINGYSKNRSEIKDVIESFDIALIPYDVSQVFNKYCYPMKIFEYFYYGKPVVSTPIVELSRFPDYVFLGNTTNEWNKIISRLAKTAWPKNHALAQKRLAENNSWEAKVNRILEIINSNKTKISYTKVLLTLFKEAR